MPKYLVTIDWSQTDKSNVLVEAKDETEARAKAMEGSNALFVSGICKVDIDKSK